MISPARIAAYDILLSLSAGRADLPTLIAHARPSLRDDRDRALAAEIATGVQRWRAALDYVIVAFAKRPLERLDPEIVEILRLSAFQLLRLTRVPASAVVDDGVNLARRAGKTSAGGFVNAVLRTVSRKREALPLPARPADAGKERDAALDYLSITLSHPRWLAARWLDRYGLDAAERWMQFDNEPAPLTLRSNPLRGAPGEIIERLAAAGVQVTRARFAPDALIVSAGHPLRTGLADQGWFVVQDEASQLVPLVAGPSAGPTILDTCASPGGKTLALAAGRPDARVVACDIRDRRMELLRRTVAAAGAANVSLVQADLLQPLPFRRQFDVVVVDAPCSGLGTLRRDPDIRWRRLERDLATLAAAQQTMIRHAADAVAPGGRLVYATCSSEPEENDAIADAFVAEGTFERVDLAAEGRIPPALIDDGGYFRTLPHVHGLEAFFGAAFRRR